MASGYALDGYGMTNTDKTDAKRTAKEALKENGLKVFIKDIELLETGWENRKIDVTDDYKIPYKWFTYIRFVDWKTGKAYSAKYRFENYSYDDHRSFWSVDEVENPYYN